MNENSDDESPATAGSGLRNMRLRLARLISGEDVELPAASDRPGAGHTHLRVKEFESACVGDVMISRVDIAAIAVDTTLGDVLKLFAEQAHSRMPVYEDSLDEPIGFVHIKDVVATLVEGGWGEETLVSRPLKRLVRKVLYVPESMPLPHLLLQMQSSRTHMALVIDEFGGTDGLVCLEDVVEEIVGDLEDEHDDVTPTVRRRGRQTWDVDGATEIEEVEETTGLSLQVEEFKDEVDTLGGLVSALAGRVPQASDSIEHPAGVILEVLAADPRRVLRVRIRPLVRQPASPYVDDARQSRSQEQGGE